MRLNRIWDSFTKIDSEVNRSIRLLRFAGYQLSKFVIDTDSEKSWPLSGVLLMHITSIDAQAGFLRYIHSVLFRIRFTLFLRRLIPLEARDYEIPNLKHLYELIKESNLDIQNDLTSLGQLVANMIEGNSKFGTVLMFALQEPIQALANAKKSLIRAEFLAFELCNPERGGVADLPTLNWDFVKDAKLRDILQRDYAELQVLLTVTAPKSTLVLSGSILEAILNSILTTREGEARAKFLELYPRQARANASPSIPDWKLYQLIEVAAALGILDEDTRRQADILRDYRNLIHPLAQYRSATDLDSELIVTEIALLKRIIRIIGRE